MIRALDLFCGAGGASMGLHRAGFDVTGVDIKPQKNYPFKFIQADAMTFPLDGGWDFIWASPPCQKYSCTKSLHPQSQHPDLVAPIRNRLQNSGIDYVIENVNGAPLLRGSIMLCGQMFGLKVFRHRWFEPSRMILAPHHSRHNGTCNSPLSKARSLELGTKGSRFGGRNGYVTVAGNNFNRLVGLKAMGIDWNMTQPECAEAIPPAYSEYIARQFIQHKQNNLQPFEAQP